MGFWCPRRRLARSEVGKPQAFHSTRARRGLPAQVVVLTLLVGLSKARGDLLLLMSCASLAVVCFLLMNLSDMAQRPLVTHSFDACLPYPELDAMLTDIRPPSTRLAGSLCRVHTATRVAIGCGFAVPISDDVRNYDSTVFWPKKAQVHTALRPVRLHAITGSASYSLRLAITSLN